MSEIRFVTDSAADIPAEQARELGIVVLPFLIAMEGKDIRDGVDMTPKEFYDALEAEAQIPTHSQITPMQFEELYEQAAADGVEHLIYTSINSKGSATYNNAFMAISMFRADHPEVKLRVHLLDSRSYTYSYGFAVVLGAQAAREGKSVQEVLDIMQDRLNYNRILFATYSLKYAKKSGRVSAAAAFLGDALGLKPIMSFPNGDSKVLNKVRGDKNVIPTILKMAKEEIEEGTPYTVILAKDEKHNQEMLEAAEKAFGYPPAGKAYIGGVIAINAGPNLTGVIFRSKEQQIVD